MPLLNLEIKESNSDGFQTARQTNGVDFGGGGGCSLLSFVIGRERQRDWL
jgi:hypothetical protein